MSEFEAALNTYAFHVRHEIGYPPTDATLMVIGFAAGWEAHRDGFDLATMPAYPSPDAHPVTACVSPARRLRWWLLDVATRWTGRPGHRGGHHWYGGGHPPTEREMAGWPIPLRPGQTRGREFQKVTHRYLGNDKWRTL